MSAVARGAYISRTPCCPKTLIANDGGRSVRRARATACGPDGGGGGNDGEPARRPRGRRDLLASSLVIAVTATGPAKVAAADDPACSSCEGAVDDTLGRCEGFATDACRSTSDDRPPYFVAPWEFDSSAADASAALLRAVEANAGSVEVDLLRDTGYLRAAFGGGTIALEFLVRGDNDAVCEVRGTLRGRKNALGLNGLSGSPVEKQLFRIRTWLGWDEVYVLRNRKQVQGFWGGGFDTPWDRFGPVPPPTMDYGNARALDDDLQ